MHDLEKAFGINFEHLVDAILRNFIVNSESIDSLNKPPAHFEFDNNITCGNVLLRPNNGHEFHLKSRKIHQKNIKIRPSGCYLWDS